MRMIYGLIIVVMGSILNPSCPKFSARHPFLVKLDSRLRGNDREDVRIILQGGYQWINLR
jgi:hypothetical protein